MTQSSLEREDSHAQLGFWKVLRFWIMIRKSPYTIGLVAVTLALLSNMTIWVRYELQHFFFNAMEKDLVQWQCWISLTRYTLQLPFSFSFDNFVFCMAIFIIHSHITWDTRGVKQVGRYEHDTLKLRHSMLKLQYSTTYAQWWAGLGYYYLGATRYTYVRNLEWF